MGIISTFDLALDLAFDLTFDLVNCLAHLLSIIKADEQLSGKNTKLDLVVLAHEVFPLKNRIVVAQVVSVVPKWCPTTPE